MQALHYFNTRRLAGLGQKAILLSLALMILFSSLAFTFASASAASCQAQHTVKRGETLYLIGRKYNMTWDKIAKANNITNANKIYVGQVLCIPASSNATPAPTATATPAPQRISFVKGAISGSVEGTVTAPARNQYVLRALKGQQMTVEIISKDKKANFAVQGVTDGQPLKRLENEDRKWTGTLPATQDYLITVASPSGSAAYTVVVTVVTK
ncbi:MAG: LysM peptidoglycan-binding domain-containing protein [Chloroflexi bacterium]|nr:LysM peptidoglycan-binding domain-containing protein [Chloroflexota bacterium]